MLITKKTNNTFHWVIYMEINCQIKCEYQNDGKCKYNTSILNSKNYSDNVKCVFYSPVQATNENVKANFWSNISNSLFC